MSSDENTIKSTNLSNIQQQQCEDLNNTQNLEKSKENENKNSLHIEIDEDSYDEADSVNEDNINNQILNSNDNCVCIKM